MMHMKPDFGGNMDHARDALHLEWLQEAASGRTSGQIGRRYGVQPSHVRTVLNRIKADLAKSETMQ